MAMEVADHTVNMSRPPQGHRLHRPVSPWTRWSWWWAGWPRGESRGQWSWNSKCQAGVCLGVLQVSSGYWDLWETLFCWLYWFKLPKKKSFLWELNGRLILPINCNRQPNMSAFPTSEGQVESEGGHGGSFQSRSFAHCQKRQPYIPLFTNPPI